LAFDFFGQSIDRTASRITHDVPVLLQRGLRISMTQLPLHNSQWRPFFQEFTSCRVTECVSASVSDAQLILPFD
jgi:hypothetical protein